jgi:hypothetical protein
LKKPFPLFDLEGLSFTVSEKVLVGCEEFFPGYKYTIDYIQTKTSNFSPIQINKHGFDSRQAWVIVGIHNGYTITRLRLKFFLEEVSPVVDKFCRKLSEPESPLVSTLSESKNEQLLLFRS